MGAIRLLGKTGPHDESVVQAVEAGQFGVTPREREREAEAFARLGLKPRTQRSILTVIQEKTNIPDNCCLGEDSVHTYISFHTIVRYPTL